MYLEDECETCDREFSSEQAAVQHMNALNHWARRYECETCDKEFFTSDSASQHMDSTGHRQPQIECETCDRRFHTQTSAGQHMTATGHWGPKIECDTCVQKFFTQDSADQHMDSVGHWEPQFECEICDCRFRTLDFVNQHMDAANHHRQNYCNDCSRGFTNENALRMHLNSRIHRGRNISCPFCRAALTTASGLSHHLETGSCPQARNINHGTMYDAIRQRDPGGAFTKKLLTYPDLEVQDIATGAAWNGSSYECYLCHRAHHTLYALNQHLSSPAHDEKLYHCPNRNCNREFVRLASLFNHLESESCNFVRFEKVQSSVRDFITGQQRLVGFA